MAIRLKDFLKDRPAKPKTHGWECTLVMGNRVVKTKDKIRVEKIRVLSEYHSKHDTPEEIKEWLLKQILELIDQLI